MNKRKNNKNAVDLETLEILYVKERKSMREVATTMGFSVGKIHKILTENDFPKREAHKGFLGKHHSEKAKSNISKAHKGKVISAETRRKMSEADKKGGIGHKKKRADGYMCVYFPDHPCSNKEGYIMEHVLVAEALLGRHLNDNECVHHINRKRDDNRKENLKVMTKSQHMSFHLKERWAKKKGLI